MSKCFCHLNGYEVKDATSRRSIETLNNITETLSNDVSILENRMNTFSSLEEGSTTGDAELIDARVDYNGKTWSSVGEHLRGVEKQLSDNIKDINAINSPHIDLYSELFNYTDHTYLSNKGEEVYEAVLRKSDYIPVIGFNRLRHHLTYNGTAQGHTGGFFDENYNFITSIGHIRDMSLAEYDVEIPENTKYLVINGLSDKSLDKTEGNYAFLYYRQKNTSGDISGDTKIINVLGDSITYGVGASNTSKRYASLLESYSNVTVNNYGLSSSRISNIADDSVASFVDRIESMDTNADMVIVFGGTNDYWHKKTIIGEKDSTDTSTFYGALNYIFDYLNTNYANKELLCVIPFKQYYASLGGNSDLDFGYGTLNDFREALINRCEYYSIPYIDLYTMSGMDMAHNTTHRTTFGNDSNDCVHPNDNGHNRIAKIISSYINTIVW